MSDHKDKTITKENAPPKVVPQITTVTNISTKFPYLKKGEYDIWAMKRQNFISSSDLLCWNIVLKGNSAKSITTDNDGNLKIHPPITAEEHQQKFEEFKISEEEGLDKGNDKMQMILTQMKTLKIKPEPEDVNMKFLRGLPPSWSGIALILKTKGGLEYISFDDLYNKLKFLEIDTKGYSSSSSTLSNVAFVNLDQMNKEEFEEYDLKHQMATLSIKVHRFEKKHRRKIKFNGRENARFDKKLVKCFKCKQMGHFSRECQSQGGQNSNNYQKYKSKEAGKDESDSKSMVVIDDTDLEGEVVSADNAIHAGVFVSAGDVPAVVVSQQSETEFALMGLSTEAKWNNSGELGIDDSKFSIFYTNSDELEGQPIYNSVECSRLNHSDHDSISSVSAPTSESRDTIVIDCDRQEDFTSVCSIETDEKSSKTLCNKFGSFNKESHFRKHKSVASKSCYVCGSYLHLIKYCDLHEQRFTKRNTEGKGILGRRPTGKQVNPNRPKPVSTGQQNPVSAGLSNPVSAEQQNTVSAGQPNPVSTGQPNPISTGEATLACNSIPLYVFVGDGILGPRPLNIQPKTLQNESTLWQRRLGHVNFKNMNKLVKGNLVRVAIACYVLNRVLVTKRHDKTPYELLTGNKPSISYLKPFGYHVTILNRSDPLGKFDKMSDEGIGTTSIGSFISAGSTPPMSPWASPISADRHFISARKSHVSAGRLTGSAGRLVSAGRPYGFADRTPVPAGRIL
nr:ribonuclease H-like domain-containing protein [Tanacetum cinerariifolium]